MPKICEFFGIVIQMYYNESIDHVPHFHAKYAGRKASFYIENPCVLEGNLHPRAERMIIEWAQEHQDELLENYQKMRNDEKPQIIEPLK